MKDLYILTVANGNEFEYKGSIIVNEKGIFKGIGLEKNYDTIVNFTGNLNDNKLDLEIDLAIKNFHTNTIHANIPIHAEKNDTLKDSLNPTNSFYGSSDIPNDDYKIELTNFKDLENSLKINKNYNKQNLKNIKTINEEKKQKK